MQRQKLGGAAGKAVVPFIGELDRIQIVTDSGQKCLDERLERGVGRDRAGMIAAKRSPETSTKMPSALAVRLPSTRI